jgi:hypothetical protein
MYNGITVFGKVFEELLIVESVARGGLGKTSGFFYVFVDVARENVNAVAINFVV